MTGVQTCALPISIYNSNQSNLTISANAGNVTFSGNLAIGATAADPTPIGDVTITTTGNVTFGTNGGTLVSNYANSLNITAAQFNIYGNTSTSLGTGVIASCQSKTGACLVAGSTFNVSSTSSISGNINGTASITKSGAGTLTLSGANTYTGATTISTGTLTVTGTLADTTAEIGRAHV